LKDHRQRLAREATTNTIRHGLADADFGETPRFPVVVVFREKQIDLPIHSFLRA
jgi:hypothetical protein